MYADDQLLAISGLCHYVFCKRRCALIHLEHLWTENYLTADGRLMHERVHEGEPETRGNLRTVRGLSLISRRLGLAGVADLVEFHREPTATLVLPGWTGTWRVYPVEYKRGKARQVNHDQIQLCAQTICLEEMLNTTIPEGALYYGQTRKRTVVPMSTELREKTEQIAAEFHQLMEKKEIPIATFKPCCKSCSLIDDCMPELSGAASRYLEKMITESAADDF